MVCTIVHIFLHLPFGHLLDFSLTVQLGDFNLDFWGYSASTYCSAFLSLRKHSDSLLTVSILHDFKQYECIVLLFCHLLAVIFLTGVFKCLPLNPLLRFTM